MASPSRCPGRALAAALLLAGCAAQGDRYVQAFGDPDSDIARFEVCHGYGCVFKTSVSMTEAAWSEVAAVFARVAAEPAAERRQVAEAVALMERKVGPVVGTDADKGGAEIFAKSRFQQDCIDETVNTTTYLRLFAQHGYLRHHEIAPAAGRGMFIDGRWPHNTAVLRETAGGRSYAIDSWFHPNGVQPAVVPLEVWLGGWSPEDGPPETS